MEQARAFVKEYGTELTELEKEDAGAARLDRIERHSPEVSNIVQSCMRPDHTIHEATIITSLIMDILYSPEKYLQP